MKRMIVKTFKTHKNKDKFNDGQSSKSKKLKIVFYCDNCGEYEAFKPRCNQCEIG